MLGDQSRRVFAFEKEDKLIEVSSQDGEFWEISSGLAFFSILHIRF